jgi:hypothetical protein
MGTKPESLPDGLPTITDARSLPLMGELLSAHEARSFVLDSWMAGEEELAGDFLIQAYLSAPDPEEQHDSRMAPALNVLVEPLRGRIPR